MHANNVFQDKPRLTNLTFYYTHLVAILHCCRRTSNSIFLHSITYLSCEKAHIVLIEQRRRCWIHPSTHPYSRKREKVLINEHQHPTPNVLFIAQQTEYTISEWASLSWSHFLKVYNIHCFLQRFFRETSYRVHTTKSRFFNAIYELYKCS